MGMLGMLRVETWAMADIMVQKQESFYDRLQRTEAKNAEFRGLCPEHRRGIKAGKPSRSSLPIISRGFFEALAFSSNIIMTLGMSHLPVQMFGEMIH